MIDLNTLRKGDVITLKSGLKREVVRVVEATGARGGIVDTKPVAGRYSRTSGFVLGDEIFDPSEPTRLLRYLNADTSFGRGGAIGEVVQMPASGDVPALIAGVIVDVKRESFGWTVEYADLTDGARYFGLASTLDFATPEQLATVGRRLAYKFAESLKETAR